MAANPHRTVAALAAVGIKFLKHIHVVDQGMVLPTHPRVAAPLVRQIVMGPNAGPTAVVANAAFVLTTNSVLMDNVSTMIRVMESRSKVAAKTNH